MTFNKRRSHNVGWFFEKTSIRVVVVGESWRFMDGMDYMHHTLSDPNIRYESIILFCCCFILCILAKLLKEMICCALECPSCDRHDKIYCCILHVVVETVFLVHQSTIKEEGRHFLWCGGFCRCRVHLSSVCRSRCNLSFLSFIITYT